MADKIAAEHPLTDAMLNVERTVATVAKESASSVYEQTRNALAVAHSKFSDDEEIKSWMTALRREYDHTDVQDLDSVSEFALWCKKTMQCAAIHIEFLHEKRWYNQ